MQVEFSLKQQLVDNLYPQFGINIPAGTLIGRLYLPKAHQYRKTPSPFAGKVQLIYDSWKSNGSFSGWTHKFNAVRVVEFILKDGISQSLFLEIAKHFSWSNLKAVRDRTNKLLLQIRNKASLAIQRVKQVVTTAIVKVRQVQTVVAEFVNTETTTQPVKPITQYLPLPTPTPKPSIVTTWDLISRFLNQEVITATPEKEQSNPVPLILPKRSDYNFTLKYKPKTYKRLAKYFKLNVQLSKENAIDTFIQNCISPYAIKRALTPKRKR